MNMKKVERLLIGFLILTLIVGIGINISADNVKIDKVNFTDATVNTTTLNMRQGPSTSMPIIAKLSKSQALKILGKTGNWYFVFDPSSSKVGCVDGQYITAVTAQSKEETKLPSEDAPSQNKIIEAPIGLSNDETVLLELVNAIRQTENVGLLTYNKELAKVATDKARDMVENNYFSHKSKTYGSPFEMMRSYGLVFSAAAENIAGNQSVEKAFYSWMESDSHKNNMINPEYDEIGIGVYISPVYGKIIVQMFLKK